MMESRDSIFEIWSSGTKIGFVPLEPITKADSIIFLVQRYFLIGVYGKEIIRWIFFGNLKRGCRDLKRIFGGGSEEPINLKTNYLVVILILASGRGYWEYREALLLPPAREVFRSSCYSFGDLAERRRDVVE